MGVSSKAYTTISNIEKHVDQHATVASLGLKTPAWLANSLVGSVSSLSSTPHVLNLFNVSLENARTFSNSKTEPLANATNLQKSDSVFGGSQLKLAALATTNDLAVKVLTTETLKSSALRALESLEAIEPSAIKSNLNARTMSTLARVMNATNTPKPSAISVNVDIFKKYSSQDITKWTLAHDVCVQIPSAVLNALSAEKLQAFKVWMTQLPDLT